MYCALSVAASSKDGGVYRSQDAGKTWKRFDKVQVHGTIMSVGLHATIPSRSTSAPATRARSSARRMAARPGRRCRCRARSRTSTRWRAGEEREVSYEQDRCAKVRSAHLQGADLPRRRRAVPRGRRQPARLSRALPGDDRRARAGREGLRGARTRRARAPRPMPARRAGRPGARCRPSTACRSASRTCSRPRTCRPRWAARPIAATSPSATTPAVWALAAGRRRHPRQDRDGRARRRASAGRRRNPFDSARTPGGSSSGSAAAVAARMLPAAIGTQVGGSIIRPAAFCGNVALKPTQGGINRGERQATSMSTHGVHAGCIEDMWQVAIEIAERAGGDRGCSGLFGPAARAGAAQARAADRAGDGGLGRARRAASKSAFEARARELERTGVAADPPRRASADREAGGGDRRRGGDLQRDHRLGEPLGACATLSTSTRTASASAPRRVLAKAEAMSVSDYRAALIEREAAQLSHAGSHRSPMRRSRSRVPGRRRIGRRRARQAARRGRPATPSSTIQAPCCSRRP